MILYSLSNASYLRTIYDPEFDPKLPARPAISWCGLTNDGHIVWYSQTDFKFHLYSLIGEKIAEMEMTSQLNTICLSNDAEYILAAGDKITFFMLRLYDFTVVNGAISEHFGGEGKPASFTQIPNLHKPVRTIRTSLNEEFIFLGMEDGEVCVVAAKV